MAIAKPPPTPEELTYEQYYGGRTYLTFPTLTIPVADLFQA